MNKIKLKTIICLILMISFLIMSFISNSEVDSKLYAALGIITGAFSYKFVSSSNTSTK